MKPVHYVVKSGDTLWSIAQAHYGDPVRWPDLYAYNNRPDILAMTERPIVNPDRMVPGQAIFLPAGRARSTQRRAPGGQASNPLRSVGSAGLPNPGGSALAPGSSRGFPSRGLSAGMPGTSSFGGSGARSGATLGTDSLNRNVAAETFVNDFAHVFHLDEEEVVVRGQTFSAALFVNGVIALQRTGQVPLARYSSPSAERQARSQSAMLLGRLLSTQATRLGFDPQDSRVTYDAMLTRNAGVTAPGAGLAQGVTQRGQPVLKGTIAIPDFLGRVANHVYLVRDLAIAVELRTGQTIEPTRQDPIVERRTTDRANWRWAAAVTTPNVLIVSTVVDEDAVTAGGGLADSATTLTGTVAGQRGGAAMIRFTSASPTPVQIGGADRATV